MAVAHRAHQEQIRTDTSDPWIGPSFTTNAGDRGLLVCVVHGVTATSHIVSCSFGGSSLSFVNRATDTVTEPGIAEWWFLGTSLPITASTVDFDLDSGTGDDIWATAIALSGTDDLEVIDTGEINENAADPTLTMVKGGRHGICYGVLYSGAAAPGGTLAANNTLGHTHDFTAFMSQYCRETTPGTSDFTVGWSTLTSDDVAFAAVCIGEVVGAVGSLVVAPQQHPPQATRYKL